MTRLLGAGVALSLISLWVGGRLRPDDVESLQAALSEQVPVTLLEAGEVDREWLVIDGRSVEAREAARPRGSMHLPFEFRNRELFQVPDGAPVQRVVVVMDVGEEAQARELALWIARQWGIERVATLVGGWPAWQAAGLPTEEGP